MRTLGRRGFTLLEMLIALALLGLLGGVALAIVRTAARASARATTALVTARTLHSLGGFLRQELRDAAVADLVVAGGTQLTVMRTIGEALPCGIAGNAVLVAQHSWNGTRAPEGGRDEALVLVDADSGMWHVTPVTGVFADHCPADTVVAWRVVLGTAEPNALAVRILEPVFLRVYRSGSADWLGLAPQDGSSAVQPFAGPLVAGTARLSLIGNMLEAQIIPVGAGPAVTRVPVGQAP